MNKKIIIGSDHAGFILKNKLAAYLQQAGFDVDDAGTYTTESCDYPIISKEVAQNIKEGKYEKGILVCGTGIGMSIAANKVKGIRAAVVSDTCSAKMSRLHNDANILGMGARVIGVGTALKIVDTFLNTPFSNDERHKRRIAKIEH